MKPRDAAVITAAWVTLVLLALFIVSALGCASASKADISTSQPVDVEQLSGQIVATGKC